MVLLFFQTNKVVAIRPAKITNLDAKMADAYPILGSAMVKMIAGIVPTKVIFVRKKRAPISRWEKDENLNGVIIKLKRLILTKLTHLFAYSLHVKVQDIAYPNPGNVMVTMTALTTLMKRTVLQLHVQEPSSSVRTSNSASTNPTNVTAFQTAMTGRTN